MRYPYGQKRAVTQCCTDTNAHRFTLAALRQHASLAPRYECIPISDIPGDGTTMRCLHCGAYEGRHTQACADFHGDPE